MEKIWKVYELYDIYGNVVYVGETKRTLQQRLRDHTKYKPGLKNGKGKFYGHELTIYAVGYFTNRKLALQLEGQLKLQYGFEWTEKTRGQKLGKNKNTKNGKVRRKLTYQDAIEIRSLYQSNYSYHKLAELYQVWPNSIVNIIKNKTYVEP